MILTSYRLSKGRKLSGAGGVIYVVIEDFYSIGEELRGNVDNQRYDRYGELIKKPKPQSVKQLEERHSFGTRRLIHQGLYDGYDYEQYNEQHNEEEHGFPFGGSPETSRELAIGMKNVLPRAASTKSLNLAFASPTSEQEARQHDELRGSIVYRSSRRHSFGTIEVDKRKNLFQASHSERRKRKRDEAFSEIDHSINSRDIKLIRLTAERSTTPPKKTRSELPATLEQNNAIASNHVGVNLAAKKKMDTPQSLDVPRKLEKTNPQYLAPPTSTAKRLTGSFATTFAGSKGLLAIKRPLRICPLVSLTGRNATRNKVHDVFAIVCSVQESVVKPPKNMPRKRDIRIMDPSTDKKVLVSVFVDPDNFQPTVGTIALFRNLTTHEWDSGMLNVYHDKCAGRAWFIKDPVEVEGCDVKALKEWWEKKKSEIEDSSVKVFAEKT